MRSDPKIVRSLLTKSALTPRSFLLATARRQGKDGIRFIVTLLTKPLDSARATLFNNTG